MLYGERGNFEIAFALSDARVVSGPSGSPLWTLPQMLYSDHTGWAVAGGYDLDGDGFDDPFVGSPSYGFNNLPPPITGRVRSFSGATGTELFVESGWLGSDFGTSIALLGDITGDDFPDFAVGASFVAGTGTCDYIPPGSTQCAGRIRIYSGAPPGVDAFGSGCAGSAWTVPRIGGTWKPSLGSTWSVDLSETVPNAPALMLFGFNETQWWGLPLPFDLAVAGMPGCPLLVSPDLIFAATTSGNAAAGGRAKIVFAIPADATLGGASVYLQWYVADPTAATPGGAATRGLAITLQS